MNDKIKSIPDPAARAKAQAAYEISATFISLIDDNPIEELIPYLLSEEDEDDVYQLCHSNDCLLGNERRGTFSVEEVEFIYNTFNKLTQKGRQCLIDGLQLITDTQVIFDRYLRDRAKTLIDPKD